MANLKMAVQSFMGEMESIIDSLIWKNQEEANKNEINKNYYEVDHYVAASRGEISFDNIPSISAETFNGFGFSPTQIISYTKNKNNIPITYRSAIVASEVNRIIANYVEKNDYYRMLYGLPVYNTPMSDYVYITDQDDIISTTPIHELSMVDKYKLESRGILATLMIQYPDLSYIKYLASNNIEPYVARSTERFGILRVIDSDPIEISQEFRDCYTESQYYMIQVHYSDAFKVDQEYYEGFVGMAILFMTMQKMFNRYIEVDKTRDFFDVESLKIIYESYGVPFYEEVPLKYHKIMVKNINKIIAIKGSSQVLIELCDLFDFESIELNSYYLTKSHKFVDGKPVFIKDGLGNLQYESNYDLTFAAVPIGQDPYQYIINKKYHSSYDSLIGQDEFWVNDEQLLKKLYESEYNYIESKYVGIQLTFDVTKIMYESCFFFRMLEDNKDITNKLFLSHDYAGLQISLFDLCIYISALICKNKGLNGVIPSNPEQIAKVYGFNFKNDLKVIRNEILANPYIDDTIADMIVGMNINNLSDVRLVFSKIQLLKEFLDRKLIISTEKNEYEAYKALRKTLLTTTNIADLYKKSNGDIATSFTDLLADRNLVLYNRMLSEDLIVDSEIEYCIQLLELLTDDLKYIHFINNMNSDVITGYLFKLLIFFKSVKTELTGFNVLFTINSRSTELIKLFMEMHKMSMNGFIDNDQMIYTDYINKIIGKSYENSRIELADYIDKIRHRITVDSSFTLKDAVALIQRQSSLYSAIELAYGDNVSIAYSNASSNDRFYLRDNIIAYIKKMFFVDTITYKDKMLLLSSIIYIFEGVLLYDTIQTISIKFSAEFNITLADDIIGKNSEWIKDQFTLTDKIVERIDIKQIDSFTYIDTLMTVVINSIIKENGMFKDVLSTISNYRKRTADSTYTLNDKLILVEIIPE